MKFRSGVTHWRWCGLLMDRLRAAAPRLRWENPDPSHRLRRLTVQHQAVVADGPRRRSRDLIAYEAVFGGNDVVRELLPMKEVAKPAVEPLVPLVRNLEHAIFDPKRLAHVLPEIEALDLCHPSAEIPTVEELNPVLVCIV